MCVKAKEESVKSKKVYNKLIKYYLIGNIRILLRVCACTFLVFTTTSPELYLSSHIICLICDMFEGRRTFLCVSIYTKNEYL